MRRIFSFLIITLMFANFASAQDNEVANDRFAIKVQPFFGSYLDKNMKYFKALGLENLSGMNLGIEFPSEQQRPWQQYLNNSTLGIGLSVIDWQSEYLGKAIAMYPYLLVPIVRNEQFQFNFKAAGGLGYVSETWYTQENHDPDKYYHLSVLSNRVFGCHLNAYLSAGVNANYYVNRNVALHGEFGYFHMSNGRTCMPNLGVNVTYGGVGVIATFNNSIVEKEPIQFPDLPYKWALNITGAAGAQRSWMEVPRYFISSFHTGAVYSVNNWYGIGAGLDVFYNGAVTSGANRDLYCDDKLVHLGGVECNTCDGEYTFADKVRAGIALNNEFRLGIVTAMVDWGVYFYNPSRFHYLQWHELHYENGGAPEKRPLFYKSIKGAGGEEAFHYIRFGMKYRVWDNLYLQASAKTHLQICEYVEFGLGYQIPFLKKGNRESGESRIFHHTKNWWE